MRGYLCSVGPSLRCQPGLHGVAEKKGFVAMASARGNPSHLLLLPHSQFDADPQRHPDKGTSACALICCRLACKFFLMAPRGHEFPRTAFKHLMKNAVQDYDEDFSVSGMTVEAQRKVLDGYECTPWDPVLHQDVIHDHVAKMGRPCALIFTAPKISDAANSGTGNSFILMIASKSAWVFDSHRHDSRLAGGQDSGAVLASFPLNSGIVDPIHWIYEKLLPSMDCKTDYLEVLAVERSARRSGAGKKRGREIEPSPAMRRIFEMDCDSVTSEPGAGSNTALPSQRVPQPAGGVPTRGGLPSSPVVNLVSEEGSPGPKESPEPVEPADPRESSAQEQGAGSNSALSSQEPADTRESPARERRARPKRAAKSNPEELVRPKRAAKSNPEELVRPKRAAKSNPEELERPKKAAKSNPEELVMAYQDAIRSLHIDFIKGTIDGERMKVKHVVGFCRTLLVGIQVPFNGKIFKAVLLDEAEKARTEFNREAMAKTEKMVARAAMFAAEPGSGNVQLERWRQAGLELQQMLHGIFQSIQHEPAGQLEEDQLGPVEVIFTGTVAVLDGSLSVPPNKQRYTDGLFPSTTFIVLLKELNKTVSSDCIALIHQLTELFFVAHARSCEILAKHAKRKSVNLQDLQVLALCTKNRFHSIAREDFLRGCADGDVSTVQLVSATLPNDLVEKAIKLIPGSRIKKAFVKQMPLRNEVVKQFSCMFLKTMMCVIDSMQKSAEKAGRQEISPVDVVAFLRTEALEFAGYGDVWERSDSGCTALPSSRGGQVCEPDASASSNSGCRALPNPSENCI